MSDEICNRIEALGYRCERWNINGDFRWVTGPNNHTTVCYFRCLNERFFRGFVTQDGVVLLHSGESMTAEQFEERHADDKPF